MEAALAVLNQLLAQLQLGRRRDKKTSSSVSCEQLVQSVAQMVSALPEDLEKVLALADALHKQTEELTCSADQISYLTKQRDWLQSQLELI